MHRFYVDPGTVPANARAAPSRGPAEPSSAHARSSSTRAVPSNAPTEPSGPRIDLPADVARQLSTVLRLRAGETIAVFDGSGAEWSVRLDHVASSGAWGEVVERREPQVEPALALTLCVGVLKADRFEFVLQRCTEAGVARFQPFVSTRCVAEMPRGAKLDRWHRIVREAAEQSGRARVPPILPVLPFEALLDRAELRPMVALWEDERSLSLRSALERLEPGGRTVSLLIGPEGGLEPSEVQGLAATGVPVATIGPRVLRAETAALAATIALLFHFGELARHQSAS